MDKVTQFINKHVKYSYPQKQAASIINIKAAQILFHGQGFLHKAAIDDVFGR